MGSGLKVIIPRGSVHCLTVKRMDIAFFNVDLANNRWQSLMELQGETDNDRDVKAVFSFIRRQ